LLSFVHGFWLIFGRPRAHVAVVHAPAGDRPTQQRKSLYVLVLVVCIAAVTLVFVTFGRMQQPQQEPDQITRERQQLIVSTVFLSLLLATLLAQFLMYARFMRPVNESWQPSAFWTLMEQGMSQVFRTVLTLVVLLAFSKIVEEILTTHRASMSALVRLPGTGWGQGGVMALALAGIFGVGWIIGSSWGTFALGILILDIFGITHDGSQETLWIRRTAVEALILLATWVNQRSASADNAQRVLGPAQCPPDAMRRVWAVPTFPGYASVQAQHIQWAILAPGIGLALLCRYRWPQVF